MTFLFLWLYYRQKQFNRKKSRAPMRAGKETTMAYIVKQPAGKGRVNIFLAENHHCPEKKSSRQTRKYIGGLDVASGELLLCAKLAEPDAGLLELLAKKDISYNGRRSGRVGRRRIRPERPARREEIIEAVRAAKVEERGRVDALEHLAEESGLAGALRVAYGDALGGRMLSAAVYQSSEGMPLYLAGEWAEETGVDGGMSSPTLSRTLSDVGGDAASLDSFFSAWIKACGTPRALIHDTTSFSSYSDRLEMVEWGYNRDKEKLPQINMALAADRDTGRPVWFRIVPGSVPDVATLALTLRELSALGLSDVSLSLDRGYFSRLNALGLHDSKLGFTIGVPPSGAEAQRLIHSSLGKLASPESSFLHGGRRLRHVDGQYAIKRDDGGEVFFPAHVFLDPERREDMAGKLEASVLELEEMFSDRRFESEDAAARAIIEDSGPLAKHLVPAKAGRQWRIARDNKFISKTTAAFCVGVVLTSKAGMRATDVLSEYRCRDIAEKMFDTAKNGVGANRLRTGDEDQARGRMLLAFLAVTLRSMLESKLRDAGLLDKHSVDEALAMLKKIKRIRLADGTVVDCEIPKKARLVKEAVERPSKHAPRR